MKTWRLKLLRFSSREKALLIFAGVFCALIFWVSDVFIDMTTCLRHAHVAAHRGDCRELHRQIKEYEEVAGVFLLLKPGVYQSILLVHNRMCTPQMAL